ncbi:MAG: BRCT domain-containing protein, partial [Bacteroidota bacterium]|nr:BRCT domain-containing protein [Bacteroidota bacterium]
TIVEKLKDAGLQFAIKENDFQPVSDKLKGLSIIISGVFENHSREELKQMIEQHGGKNVTSISKNTSYLLAGDKIGPSKLENAQKLGVPLLSEEDFIKMIQ